GASTLFIALPMCSSGSEKGFLMAHYIIVPARETLRGSFSRDYTPILTIDSGDTVVYSTLDAGWHLKSITTNEDEEQSKFEPRDVERDNGHALCGPIAIRGARPGMTLEVQI